MREKVLITDFTVVPWSRTDLLTNVETVDLFESIYVLNNTNFNFSYQKVLQSHIGTKGVVPAPGAIEAWATGKHVVYTIVKFNKKDNKWEPIGIGTICNIDFNNRNCEVKFVLNPEFYGKGYTRYSFHAILKEAFENLLMNSIELRLIKDIKTFPTYNALTKYARLVGKLKSVYEINGRMHSVYLMQCNEYSFRNMQMRGRS